MNNKNLSPIKDLSSQTFDDLFSRFQNLDTECLLVYLFDKVEESALIHLAEQFHMPLWCTDTKELYIGTGDGVSKVSGSEQSIDTYTKDEIDDLIGDIESLLQEV